MRRARYCRVNQILALNGSKPPRTFPDKDRGPTECSYRLSCLAVCKGQVSPPWHKHTLPACLPAGAGSNLHLLWESLSTESMPILNGNLLLVICLEGSFTWTAQLNSVLLLGIVRYVINTLWRPHIGVALRMASFCLKRFTRIIPINLTPLLAGFHHMG